MCYKKENGVQQQCVWSAFPKETMFINHIMCEYTCIPLQSVEIPGHLVQLWQSRKGLRERKFENSEKTDGRERIYHFLQQNYCVTP